MDDKTRKAIVKDKVVSSMAKKLANEEMAADIEKIKKKRRRKPLVGYVAAILFTVVMTVLFYFAILSTEKVQEEQRIAVQIALEDNPLSRLQTALTNDLITADQYALYCRDLLLRYDSLPEQYKTDKVILSREDVYSSIISVWFNLYPRTKAALTGELVGLKEAVEKHFDSLGLN
ncbi:MAG: hypothetical protein GX639_19585 [Fibrobacter sp.]|nr:hypothetical protein [Fibrobacter sp.]